MEEKEGRVQMTSEHLLWQIGTIRGVPLEVIRRGEEDHEPAIPAANDRRVAATTGQAGTGLQHPRGHEHQGVDREATDESEPARGVMG